MIGVNIVNNLTQDIDPRSLDLLGKMGNRAIRYGINGVDVIKGPGDYDLKRTRAELLKIRRSGHYTYAGWTGIPAFMSEGKFAYGPFSCWVPWKPGDPEKRDGTPAEMASGGGWRFARPSEKPYCHPPNCPQVDANEVERFTEALAGECGSLIDWFGPGVNEDDLRDFWPPIAQPPYEKPYLQLIDQVIVPAARGYRRGSTGGAALIVGPDTATAGGLMMILELLDGLGLLDTFDILSGHLYAWDGVFPGDSFDRAADFLRRAYELGGGRVFWNTESDQRFPSSVPGYDFVSWYIEAQEKFGEQIRAHFRLSPWEYFEGGEPAWRAKQYVPNDQYRRMQAYLASGGESGDRRRAARTP